MDFRRGTCVFEYSHVLMRGNERTFAFAEDIEFLAPLTWVILEPIRNPRGYILISLNFSLTRTQELIAGR